MQIMSINAPEGCQHGAQVTSREPYRSCTHINTNRQSTGGFLVLPSPLCSHGELTVAKKCNNEFDEVLDDQLLCR